MTNALGLLALVIGIAALEIWRVLRDIRNAIQIVAEDRDGSEEKLDAIVAELNRIGDILGGILASIPTSPSEPGPRSDWDRLRATWGIKKPRDG